MNCLRYYFSFFVREVSVSPFWVKFGKVVFARKDFYITLFTYNRQKFIYD